MDHEFQIGDVVIVKNTHIGVKKGDLAKVVEYAGYFMKGMVTNQTLGTIAPIAGHYWRVTPQPAFVEPSQPKEAVVPQSSITLYFRAGGGFDVKDILKKAMRRD